MKKVNQILIVMFAVMVTACGSSSTRDYTSQGLSTGGSSTGTTGTSGIQTGNIYNLPLAPEFDAQISGQGGPHPAETFSTGTSHLIRVKVTPLQAPHLTIAPYTNWVFPYGCLRLQVSVNGVTRSTQVLKVGNVTQGSSSPCANAPESQILDFSNTATGASNITVTVTSPEYDNCRQQWPMNYGCYMSAVWLNHMVAATIAVQTDGTYLE